jgi:adenine-specific DNA-methyltransferase
LRDAVDQLKRLGRPFLNWAGKAERLSFDVPTLPLFVHERLSTMAIVETLKGHTKEARGPQLGMFELFGDPQRPIADQVLKAYEYRDKWVNRMILGDSLVVMNSLLHYEGLGGQVQMIYIDPPYGVKFGSNFQPFVRKRDVDHNDDEDMTREPETVKAYRDTWELGLHSYLTYMRDRLLLARELLHPTGSVFVQIGGENLHHVRELMGEIFGENNFITVINFVTANAQTGTLLEDNCDYLLQYGRDKSVTKHRVPFLPKTELKGGQVAYRFVELLDGVRRPMTKQERANTDLLPSGARIFRADKLMSSHPPGSFPVEFEGESYTPKKGYWSTGEKGMDRLKAARRLIAVGETLSYVRFIDDFPAFPIGSQWTDTITSGFTSDKVYAVQTNTKVIQRCLLMTTDPGDLVLDPTCGSGTTAYVAEQWGRRWITIDTSRVPLALARQRLLTATFPYYLLKDDGRGPAGGFVYARRQNRRGEEVGGIVPHVTLKSIANSEPPDEEVLVDRPEIEGNVTRVSGPFCVEATIPTPVDWDGIGEAGDSIEADDYGSYLDRMLDVLRRSPVLQVGGGKTVMLKNIRPPAKSLALSAEAMVDNGSEYPVALVFGPENGAVIERSVYEAAREAYAKSYAHLYVIGFAIQPNARRLIEECESAVGIPATWVAATPDLMMGDLLKTMRSSQIFSVCGMPDIGFKKLPQAAGEPLRYEVTLRGLDVFDPITMTPSHLRGDDVPAWLLDTDYNGLVFHGSQVFFPRTGAWDNLKKALKATHDETVWDHLAGTVSAPFEAGEHRQIAVKVIDDRGNELIVVKPRTEAE